MEAILQWQCRSDGVTVIPIGQKGLGPPGWVIFFHSANNWPQQLFEMICQGLKWLTDTARVCRNPSHNCRVSSGRGVIARRHQEMETRCAAGLVVCPISHLQQLLASHSCSWFSEWIAFSLMVK